MTLQSIWWPSRDRVICATTLLGTHLESSRTKPNNKITLISAEIQEGLTWINEGHVQRISRCSDRKPNSRYDYTNFILPQSICNGIDECPDGEDEKNCSGRFECKAGEQELPSGAIKVGTETNTYFN